MTILFNDSETRSCADLKKVGNYRYARDPSTRCLMWAYAFDQEKVQQWVPAHGEPMPQDLRDALRDPSVVKRAWNAPMEKTILEYVIGEEVIDEEWRCTMAHAMTLSFPGALDKVGPILDLPTDSQKDALGKKLVRMFTIPKKPSKKEPYRWRTRYTHPDEWEQFLAYNRQDVVAEREIYNVIRRWDLPDFEWDLWALDQRINRRGVPINWKVVEGAIGLVEHVRDQRFKIIKRMTGVDNPNSRPQILDWLRENGYRFDDLKKGHVERAAADPSMSDEVRKVLGLRLEVSRTSPDKFYAFERAMSFEGQDVHPVVQGTFQFAGAQRTWRWSGRIFQPQNLPRPAKQFEDCQPKLVEHLVKKTPEALNYLYDKPMDMLASAVRPTIQADPGHVFVSADLNAIENRVLGWLADDQKILDVFRNNRDPYIDFATYLYDADYETLWKEFKEEKKKEKRTIAKPGVLGCGYMLSAGEARENKKTGEMEATGLLGYAWNMGVQLTQEQAKLSVEVWRDTFTDAVQFWWDIEAAAKKCLKTGKETECGVVAFDRSGPFMRMILPSGRCLYYCRPRLEEVALVWCEQQRKYLPTYLCKRPNYGRVKNKQQITYEGLDDRNKWVRIQTHPGKLTENADQAISRDLLAHGMVLAEQEGIKVRLHVHDEIVGQVREKGADEKLKTLIECMSERPRWAKGLPLGAAGSVSKVWIKD